MKRNNAKKRRGFWVADVPWPTVEERLINGSSALLFVGSASKEHGRHLPMGTDYFVAQWLGERLIDRLDVAIWPTLSYGYYPAFIDYPGSCSLPADLFTALVESVVKDIHRSGAKRLFIINTGISTIKSIDRAICGLDECNVKAIHVFKSPAYSKIAKELECQRNGSHADELETSKMLIIDPTKVDLALARPCDEKRFIPGPFSRKDQSSANYSPDGVYGDPTLATKEKGSKVLESIVSLLNETISTLH